MPTKDAQRVVANVIDAHGGTDYWESLAGLEAEISARGLLFTVKRRTPLDHVRIHADTKKPNFTFFDFPEPGQTGEFVGGDEVRILASDGSILASRQNPRAEFRRLRRQLYWDDLDFIYFAAYATWNYLTAPFLFLHDGFEFEILQLQSGLPESWLRLRVVFPDDVPTHSKEQIFYFDDEYRVTRLDYTAEVVGGWAFAAHRCEEYRDFDGYAAPTHRRVRPILFGSNPMPGPTLVALDIHDLRPIHTS